MILLGIILILFNYILLGFKPTNVLSCGLAGFYPKPGKQGDLNKIFMMGIMNEERGTDNCGITIGNDRFTGMKNLTKARDFINVRGATIREVPLRNKPIIFHTRKSNFGCAVESNVHPFVLQKEEEYFVLAHNGVLRLEYELKRDFFKDIPHSEFGIDSHYLLHGLALSHYGGSVDRHEFLKAYKGDAALLFYTNDTFYAWKGGNNNVEERPLYYIETPEGWYFCSLDSTLMILWNDEFPVTEVDNNQLITFKKIKGRVKIKREIITRETPKVVHTPSTSYYTRKEETDWETAFDYHHNNKKAVNKFLEAVEPTCTLNVVKRKDNSVQLLKGASVEKTNLFTIAHSSEISGKLINGDNKVLHGDYRTSLDPLYIQNILCLYPSTDMTKHFVNTIHHGIHIQNKKAKEYVGTLLVKWSKARLAREFFEENKKYLDEIVVDYFPFLYKGKVILLVYRDANGDLDWCTGYDQVFTPITIHPGIGPSIRFTQRESKDTINEIDNKALKYLHVEKVVNPTNAGYNRDKISLFKESF